MADVTEALERLADLRDRGILTLMRGCTFHR